MTPLEHRQFGFLRVATVAPELRLGDPAFNADRTIEALDQLGTEGVELAVFPELGLTGYSCADLFASAALRAAALRALARVVEATRTRPIVALVGLPLEIDGRLFNVAAVAAAGEIQGLVPKSFLPTTQEFYEERWFARAEALTRDEIEIAGTPVPVGTDLLFDLAGRPHACLGLEICEDLWAVEPPSGALALAGATILANLSAGNELLGKAAYRRDLVVQQSARLLAAYVYAGAGPGESSTDLVFSGHQLIAEAGQLLAESRAFQFSTDVVIADVDLQRLTHERLRNSSFSAATAGGFRRVRVPLGEPAATGLRRTIAAHPFVPSDPAARRANCREIFALQATALARRVRHTNSRTLVLGLSGGLDSTLAALVAVHALAKLGRPAADLLAVVMPGPGSTDRTQGNAAALAAALGATLRTIPIGPAVAAHLADIAHPEGLHDATYENAQARERTQILMDVANQTGGLLVGTGDLSEAALGWCTFNGDHMSMYHVNAGVPKTLVRHLVTWCAEDEFADPVRSLLLDIVATPITPELLPAGQNTEDAVGPYELHDFFLFHMVRHACGPAKILALAELAFAGRHDRATLLRWLRVFVTRFFAHQFKRSAMPDGPKIGTVALSPRGDWRMPSDASAQAWLAELETL